MQPDSPAPNAPGIRSGEFIFRLVPVSRNDEAILSITAERDALDATAYKLDVSEDMVESTMRGLCFSVAHLAECIRSALRRTDNWTAQVTHDMERQTVSLTVRHPLGFRDIEFTLVLVGERLSTTERLDKMAHVVGHRTDDVLTERHPNFDFFHAGLAAVVARPNAAHIGVSTGAQYSEGRHYLEWRVLRCASNQCTVGVREELDTLAQYPGHATVASGKSLYGNNGQCFRDGTAANYELGTFGPGEYVGVLLDMDAHTVSFSINGRTGSALPLTGRAYYFVSTLYTLGDAIELLPQNCWHKYRQ